MATYWTVLIYGMRLGDNAYVRKNKPAFKEFLLSSSSRNFLSYILLGYLYLSLINQKELLKASFKSNDFTYILVYKIYSKILIQNFWSFKVNVITIFHYLYLVYKIKFGSILWKPNGYQMIILKTLMYLRAF